MMIDADHQAALRHEAEHWLFDSEPPVSLYPRQEGLPRIRVAKVIATRGCWAQCTFCNFSYLVKRNRRSAPAPVIDIAQVRHAVRERAPVDVIKLVTGLSFGEPSMYFTQLIASVRERRDARVQAFSAVELDQLSRRENCSARQILVQWRQAGMDQLGPGGSELLIDEVRQRVSPYRLSTERFLEIHKVAHQSGLTSVAGLLIDRQTKPEHILEHLDRLSTIASGLDAIELQCFEPEKSPLSIVPGARLDQILRALKAIKTMYPHLPVRLNQRTIFSIDREVLLAEAGLDSVLQTVWEVEP